MTGERRLCTNIRTLEIKEEFMSADGPFTCDEIGDLNIDFENFETGEPIPIVIPNVFIIADQRVFILGILDLLDTDRPQRGMDIATGRIYLRGITPALRAVQLVEPVSGTSTLRMVTRTPRLLPTNVTIPQGTTTAMDARIISITDAADELLADIRRENASTDHDDDGQYIETQSVDGQQTPK